MVKPATNETRKRSANTYSSVVDRQAVADGKRERKEKSGGGQKVVVKSNDHQEAPPLEGRGKGKKKKGSDATQQNAGHKSTVCEWLGSPLYPQRWIVSDF